VAVLRNREQYPQPESCQIIPTHRDSSSPRSSCSPQQPQSHDLSLEVTGHIINFMCQGADAEGDESFSATRQIMILQRHAGSHSHEDDMMDGTLLSLLQGRKGVGRGEKCQECVLSFLARSRTCKERKRRPSGFLLAWKSE
jgi:hypothetical protein